MRVVHKESDHFRLERVFHTLLPKPEQNLVNSNQKPIDCTQCEIQFDSDEEFRSHIENHNIKTKIQSAVKEDEVITNKKDVDEENEFDEEYKVEEDLEDVPESLKIRIKLKCWAEDFKVARNKFKPTFKKGATFTIY